MELQKYQPRQSLCLTSCLKYRKPCHEISFKDAKHFYCKCSNIKTKTEIQSVPKLPAAVNNPIADAP
jgi:hypothetical protein